MNPNGAAEASEEQEVTLKFVPFPVCLPGDKELVWLLGKRENLSPSISEQESAQIEARFRTNLGKNASLMVLRGSSDDVQFLRDVGN